jgi:flagellar basal body P-ring formation protein FlgA
LIIVAPSATLDRALRRIVGSTPENISSIRRDKVGQFGALQPAVLPTLEAVNPGPVFCSIVLCGALAGVLAPVAAQAQAGNPSSAVDSGLASQVQQFALEASRKMAMPGLRLQVQVGQLDPRLRLAPCHSVQPYLPSGTRLWGATRIGLRCLDGAARWNVFLPIRVDVFGPALVANAPLPAGHVLAAADLRSAEVNLAATPTAPLARQELAVGRALARPLVAGSAVQAVDLRARLWFAAGDSVRLVAAGNGWRIHGEGLAMAPGIEGQRVRVRTESGRIVSGVAVAERLVEVAL